LPHGQADRLTADYAFGQALERDTAAVIEANGGKVVGRVRHPLNANDFSSFLLQAQASKAKVIGLANAGGDTINSIKQAAEFGIVKGGQNIAGLLIFAPDVAALGLPAAQGLMLTETWYWDMNDASRAWTRRWQAERPRKVPAMTHAGDYSAVCTSKQPLIGKGFSGAEHRGRIPLHETRAGRPFGLQPLTRSARSLRRHVRLRRRDDHCAAWAVGPRERETPQRLPGMRPRGRHPLDGFPRGQMKAHHGDRCACGLYSWRNRPYVCCMSIEPQQLPADCRRAGDILARVGDKWTILLLMVLGDRRMRFTELHRAINSISQRMLTVTLRNLEHDGILIRTVYPTIPPRVEYELSDRGRSLKVALAPIGNWVRENQTDIEEARERFREQSPRKALTSVIKAATSLTGG
jgi:DNA-binding HxlR family transcriptional regulator